MNGFFPLVKSEDVSQIDSLVTSEKGYRDWIDTELDILRVQLRTLAYWKCRKSNEKVHVETDVSTCTQPHKTGRNLIQCTNGPPYMPLYILEFSITTEWRTRRLSQFTGCMLLGGLWSAWSWLWLFSWILDYPVYFCFCIETCRLVVAEVEILCSRWSFFFVGHAVSCHTVKLAPKLSRQNIFNWGRVTVDGEESAEMEVEHRYLSANSRENRYTKGI